MIGQMKDRITIQIVMRTIDAQGGAVELWTDKCNLWAEIKPATSNQQWTSQHLGYFATHKITIRYRSDLNTSMRVKHLDIIYYIHQLMKIDKGSKYLQLVVAQGGIS